MVDGANVDQGSFGLLLFRSGSLKFHNCNYFLKILYHIKAHGSDCPGSVNVPLTVRGLCSGDCYVSAWTASFRRDLTSGFTFCMS